MEIEVLAEWMVRRGVLSREALRRARQRQAIFGGCLDTAVLELGLCEEGAAAAALAEATGLPLPQAEWLEGAAVEVKGLLGHAAARRLGGQPVARVEQRIQVVIRHGAALVEITAWAALQESGVQCFIVPEVRFEALLAAVHGTAVPPRFASLLGRIVGRGKARRLAGPHTAGSRAVARPPVDTGPRPHRPPRPAAPETEGELDVTEDVGDVPSPRDEPRETPAPAVAVPMALPAAQVAPKAAPAATSGGPPLADEQALLGEWAADGTAPARKRQIARALRRKSGAPVVAQALQRWRVQAAGSGAEAVAAIEALGELGDSEAVPLLIDHLNDEDSPTGKAALAALVAITRHDFGDARWRWSRWWREWKGRHRIEWLIDALTEKNAELRLQAAQELEELSGRYVGYHFDLGRREREDARRRWFDWWQSTGKALLG